VKALATIGAVVIGGMLATAGGANAADTQLPLPDVTVTAPGPTSTPPYMRDPSKAFGRNQEGGRNRVEEDKFARVPCTVTRVSAAAGTCLQGYRLGGLGGDAYRACDLQLDVTMFETAQISVEADVQIFDPYKVTATGSSAAHCSIRGYRDFDAEDFQDINQVTRRGTNFRNLVGAGDDKSIEFDVDGHHCKAVRHTGPRWQRGYIYIGHISICRKDAAQVQAEDIAYVFSTLRVRTYEPEGNLRGATAADGPVAPPPSDPNVEVRPR
jgi:hypothetical protein